MLTANAGSNLHEHLKFPQQCSESDFMDLFCVCGRSASSFSRTGEDSTSCTGYNFWSMCETNFDVCDLPAPSFYSSKPQIIVRNQPWFISISTHSMCFRVCGRMLSIEHQLSELSNLVRVPFNISSISFAKWELLEEENALTLSRHCRM